MCDDLVALRWEKKTTELGNLAEISRPKLYQPSGVYAS